jgi:SAM-dependent methyltransferase
MDRQEFLKEKRRLAEERMNTLFAPSYDDQWGAYINPSHGEFLHKFLALCPPDCTVLDAACGTGKYWPLIRDSGRTVAGFDQSVEMLKRAQAKFPEVPVRKLGLQDLPDENVFDAIICMDAMENICPEDWPVVLGNFYRALRPHGLLYFTVELAEPQTTQVAFERGRQLGLPVVYGEWVHEGGYHYYPAIAQVKSWVAATHMSILDETVGDEYHHFIVRR